MRFADETDFSYRAVTIALVSEYRLQDAGGARLVATTGR
jgi:hypothetical protein